MEKIPILEAISQPRRAIIPLPLQASGTLSIIVRHGIPAVIRPRRVISSENDKKIVRKEGRKEEKKQRAKRKGEEKLTGSVDRHTLFFAKKKKKDYLFERVSKYTATATVSFAQSEETEHS